MQPQPLRWGILGAANIAERAMIPGIQASLWGRVAAIASRDGVKAQSMAERLDIPVWYGTYEDLLSDPNIDVIYIPLPNHLHAEWTVRAAQAGKHVLCEKPAALSAVEALRMVEACESAGVQFAEAFMYRYHPRYTKIRQLIAEGTIGELRGMHATFTFNNAQDQGNIRYQRQMGGGSLYDVGCYPISAARLVFGTEPKAATVTALISDAHDGVDMMASGLLEFPDQLALTFDCGMWADFRNHLEILGTDGRIEVPHAFLGPANFRVWSRGEEREEEFPELNPYTLQADRFAQSILHQEPLAFDPMDAVRNMAALDACLASAYQGDRRLVQRTD